MKPLVVDTNVILAAASSSKGFSFLLLKDMLEGKIPFLMNAPLALEYWTVLTRKETLARIRLTASEVETLLAWLTQNATTQDVFFKWRPNLPDENDNFLFELAVAGDAESIVTFNKRDFFTAELKFDLVIETPREFYARRRRT